MSGERFSVRFPSRIVFICVRLPNGCAIPRRAASTPATKVVATAPKPGSSTPSLPSAGRISSGRFTFVLDRWVERIPGGIPETCYGDLLREDDPAAGTLLDALGHRLVHAVHHLLEVRLRGDHPLERRAGLQRLRDLGVLPAEILRGLLTGPHRGLELLLERLDTVPKLDQLAVLVHRVHRAAERLVLVGARERVPEVPRLFHDARHRSNLLDVVLVLVRARAVRGSRSFSVTLAILQPSSRSSWCSWARVAVTMRSFPARARPMVISTQRPSSSSMRATPRVCPAPTSRASRPPPRSRSGAPATSTRSTSRPSGPANSAPSGSHPTTSGWSAERSDSAT